MAKAEADKRADFLLKQLELDEAGDQKLSTYSTGMRQRLSLARALIHRPQILFLTNLLPDLIRKALRM